MKRRLGLLPFLMFTMNAFANCPTFVNGSYNCVNQDEEEVLNVTQTIENGAQKYVIGEYVFIADAVPRPLVIDGSEFGNASAICNKGNIEVSMIDAEKEIPGGSLKIIVSKEGQGFKVSTVADIPGQATLTEVQSVCKKL